MRATPSITAYVDGPFLVRGPVDIYDEDGIAVRIRRSIVPLCRCGRSRTAPLCDGSHVASPRREGARAPNGADRAGTSPPDGS